MEELINLIRNLQSKFEEQTNEIRDMKQSIPQTINSNIDTKFANLELKYNTLQKSVDMQSQRIQQLERKIRKKNLIFFGVEESERNYFDLQQGILDILEQKMGLNCNETNIEEQYMVKQPDQNKDLHSTSPHIDKTSTVLSQPRLNIKN
ncbi:Endonuclease-reverse transcriptase [Operophtera brumata]|uniref:Endonuclease-reverse transcriptase n=1 Tax=Operophtera brumata TaxID=104452 RepID=A0A0L7K3B6_OPEBR|nr:Endonuclease-reverse transcriptase [Operophtera brumata]